MTKLATNALLHQGCSGAVLPVGWRDALLLPSWVLSGGRAHVVQEHPPGLHCAFVGTFPLLLGLCTSPTATAVHQKGK